MKKRIISVLLCMILLLSHTTVVSATPAADAPVMDGKTIVTFGDSITALSTWPQSIASALNMHLVNSGIGGNTTAHALARFDRDVAAHNPDFVIMCFGTNDFHRIDGSPRVDLDTYTANMQALIDRVKAIGATPILMTPPFISEAASGGSANYPEGTVNAALDKYVEAMRSLAAQNGALLIDIHSVCDSYTVSQFLVSDGVHLSAQGNQVYTDTIVNFMQANFNQDPNAERVEQPVAPKAEAGAWTKPIAPQDVNDWLIIYPDDLEGANNADGSVSFWNTNNQWPEVHYSPKMENAVCAPVKGSYLTIDVDFEAGSNILLFFNGPTPTLAYDNSCYISLTPHLAKAVPHLQTSSDDILSNQTVQTTLALEDIVPTNLIASDGTVLFTGVKVFVVGDAGQKVTIHELSVTTTDGTETPITPDYRDEVDLLPTALSQVSRNQGYAAFGIGDGSLTVSRDLVDTLSWPSVRVACNKTLDLSETPYLHLAVSTPSGCANGYINYTTSTGTTGSVQISQLINGSANDIVTATDVYIDFAKYLGTTRTVTITDYTLSVYGDINATVIWTALAAAGDANNDFRMGDADKNGVINTADAVDILHYVLGKDVFDALGVKLADMNGDGTITTADAREVLIYIVNQ